MTPLQPIFGGRGPHGWKGSFPKLAFVGNSPQ
jgi:hypothetical protein